MAAAISMWRKFLIAIAIAFVVFVGLFAGDKTLSDYQSYVQSLFDDVDYEQTDEMVFRTNEIQPGEQVMINE